MARVVVQIPFSSRCLSPMWSIIEACRVAGHQVRPWLGPLGTWIPNRWWAGQAELAFVWNGVKPRYLPGIRTLHGLGAKIIYVEHGWYPQRPTIQMDPVGINVAAGWVSRPLTSSGRTPLPVRERGDLLLVLQYDKDVQITEYSPWFPDMEQFVEHVLAHSSLPVRVRAHPRHPSPAALRKRIELAGHTWDTSPSLSSALETCRAVACVNSSSAIEALTKGLPVLCFGDAIYRHPGAVYCLDNDPAALRAATLELAGGQSSLLVERIEEMLARVRRHQYAIADLPKILPPLIDEWQTGQRIDHIKRSRRAG